MFFIKLLKSILSILQSQESPKEVAMGVCLGAMIGLSPFDCLHTYLILILIFIVKVNMGAAFLSIALFKLVGFCLDPLAHLIGYLLLVKANFLNGLWVYLYNLPILPYTRFNNTVVLGSFVLALILFIPIFHGTIKLLHLYRAHWYEKVEKSRIMKWLKMTKIYDIYSRYQG